MDEYLVLLGLIALPLSLVGFVGASTGFSIELLVKLSARKEKVLVHQQAVVENELRDELVVVEKKVNYRHNLHCPKCGRFAARVPDSIATSCKHHGILLRADTGPIKIELIISSENDLLPL